MKHCKICGKPISGKAKYCADCQRQKERDYQKRRYDSDEEFRSKKIQSAKKRQQKQSKLGSLYKYSEHSQNDFDKEYKVVQSMKKKAFSGKPNSRTSSNTPNENYNVEAYARYNEAIGYENQKLDTFKKCPVCGGTVFERMNGMIVCKTCGICEDIFCMSVFGFDELTAEDLNSDFLRALSKLGDKNE